MALAPLPQSSIPDPEPLETPYVQRGGTFAALGVESFGLLWASGWFWNATRWMSVFLCSFLVNDLTGSPFLVQLVGAALGPGGEGFDWFELRLTVGDQRLPGAGQQAAARGI